VLGTALLFAGVGSICAEPGSAERLRFSDEGTVVFGVNFVGRDDTVSFTTGVAGEAALARAAGAGGLDAAAVLAAAPGASPEDTLSPWRSVAIDAAGGSTRGGLDKTVALATLGAGVVGAGFLPGTAILAAVEATSGVVDSVRDATFPSLAPTLALCDGRVRDDLFTDPSAYENRRHK
jgi:hypothetical protein